MRDAWCKCGKRLSVADKDGTCLFCHEEAATALAAKATAPKPAPKMKPPLQCACGRGKVAFYNQCNQCLQERAEQGSNTAGRGPLN